MGLRWGCLGESRLALEKALRVWRWGAGILQAWKLGPSSGAASEHPHQGRVHKGGFRETEQVREAHMGRDVGSQKHSGLRQGRVERQGRWGAELHLEITAGHVASSSHLPGPRAAGAGVAGLLDRAAGTVTILGLCLLHLPATPALGRNKDSGTVHSHRSHSTSQGLDVSKSSPAPRQ